LRKLIKKRAPGGVKRGNPSMRETRGGGWGGKGWDFSHRKGPPPSKREPKKKKGTSSMRVWTGGISKKKIC